MNSAAGILLLFAGGLIAHKNHIQKRKSKRVYSLTAIKEAEHNHGILLNKNSIEIVDWSAWMDYAPDQFLEAVRKGISDPQELLAYVFNGIFPALRWPPSQTSPYWETWKALVLRVEQTLPRISADGTPILRVL